VTENTAVDITVDFDLSKSIVVEGPAITPSYKLKPLMHIVETAEAATIEGFIANGSFGADFVEISVVERSTGEDYTKVKVEMATSGTETSYSIFWLLSNRAYTVKINYNPGSNKDRS
jgi:hypothetical protein